MGYLEHTYQVVDLGHIVGNLETLFVTKHFIILIPDEFVVVHHVLEDGVVDLFCDLLLVDGSVEVYEDGMANASLGLDTGLNAVNSLPELIVCPSLELVHELCIADNLH